MSEPELLAALDYWFEYKQDHLSIGSDYGVADRFLELIKLEMEMRAANG
jgi:hypothetical protein